MPPLYRTHPIAEMPPPGPALRFAGKAQPPEPVANALARTGYRVTSADLAWLRTLPYNVTEELGTGQDTEAHSVFRTDDGRILKFYKPRFMPQAPTLWRPFDAQEFERGRPPADPAAKREISGYMVQQPVEPLETWKLTPQDADLLSDFEDFLHSLHYAFGDGVQVGAFADPKTGERCLAVYDVGSVGFKNEWTGKSRKPASPGHVSKRPAFEEAARHYVKLLNLVHAYTEPEARNAGQTPDRIAADFAEKLGALRQVVRDNKLTPFYHSRVFDALLATPVGQAATANAVRTGVAGQIVVSSGQKPSA